MIVDGYNPRDYEHKVVILTSGRGAEGTLLPLFSDGWELWESVSYSNSAMLHLVRELNKVGFNAQGEKHAS